ncbi:lycopene cyclase domain-containing protein [Planosporangium sp. 12N6]|uniref:lycopene cyclase domain-containing protein n=1 Tax=Planosporangium spinosum TaxID=3402278 RepID=UPI003CF4E3F7
MRHLLYLAVLLGCLAGALWLEPVLRVGVLRRWRRLLLTLLPVATVFTAWDVAAIAAGHWSFDAAQTTGVLLPGGLPLEELLFFLVVPVCAILGFEAVRTVLARWNGSAPLRRDGSAPLRRDGSATGLDRPGEAP